MILSCNFVEVMQEKRDVGKDQNESYDIMTTEHNSNFLQTKGPNPLTLKLAMFLCKIQLKYMITSEE